MLETIRCQNGKLENLVYHNDRLNRSRRMIWGAEDTWDLEVITHPRPNSNGGVFKCRLVYGLEIESITFEPYQIRPVYRLQLVEADQLEYACKFADRSALNALMEGIEADDILMVSNGLITETSYANIAFFDGSQWFTPAVPLLAGTRRAALLDSGVILPESIKPTDLKHFRQAKLINAMMTWHESPVIDIENILC